MSDLNAKDQVRIEQQEPGLDYECLKSKQNLLF